MNNNVNGQTADVDGNLYFCHNGYYTLDILYIAAYYARCGHFWNFINTVYQLVTTSIVAKLLDRDDYANKIDVFLGTVEEG